MLTTVLAAGLASSAAAQGVPTPAELPAYDPSTQLLAEGPGEMAETIPGPDETATPFSPLAPIPMEQYDPLSLVGQCPAITESSGSWIRRGLWYADLDAVVMSRTWDSDGLLMVEEYDAVLDQSTGSINAFQINAIVPVQRAQLGESSPGYDGSGRLALGRFLFRDQANRDHTFEMVVFGGAELTERLGVEAQLTDGPPPSGVDNLPPGLIQILQGNQVRDQRGLHVTGGVDGSFPLRIDDVFGFKSFDRANAMQVEYSSRFSSWEWNYNMAQRMRKDRMELKPSGEWVRRASPGFTWEYIAGLRYFDVEERLDWYAQGIASLEEDQNINTANADGAYNIRTSNNLFGLQLGAGLTYESDRWNVTVTTKHGFYINDARGTADLRYTDPDNNAAIALNNYNWDLHVNEVSYLTQGSIMARYHLRPNLSLRAGWEFMFVTGLALAPNQQHFNPAVNQLHATGDVLYHGISVGTEYYW